MRPTETFIGQPVRSLQTMLRVISRQNRSVPTLIPDGIYGPTTSRAVAAFQRFAGLKGTGTVDQTTWETIAAQYDKAIIEVDPAEPIEILLEPGEIIRVGEYDPHIYLVQCILTQLSRDHPSINQPPHNGMLDNETSSAIRQFQELAGLGQTGELDRETWRNLSKHFTLNVHHNRRKVRI